MSDKSADGYRDSKECRILLGGGLGRSISANDNTRRERDYNKHIIIGGARGIAMHVEGACLTKHYRVEVNAIADRQAAYLHRHARSSHMERP